MNNIIDDKLLYLYMPQAENVMLNEIPSEGELEHKFSKRFTRKMKALFKYERRSPAMRSFVRHTKTAAAIFAIVFITAFATLMSVEAIRERIIEFITEIKRDLISVTISNDDVYADDEIVRIEPSYLPEGYHVYERQATDFSNHIIYINDEGKHIFYNQDMISGTTLFDTFGAEIETITIKSQKVTIIVEDKTVQIYWFDEAYLYRILGYIEKDELIQMAESIIEKE